MDKRLILLVACLVSLLGCPGEQGDGQVGQPSGGETTKPAKSGAGDGKPWDAALGTATIMGSVKFDGKPPRMRPIDMAGADAKCAELHGGAVVHRTTEAASRDFTGHHFSPNGRRSISNVHAERCCCVRWWTDSAMSAGWMK